jgi:hypothetical protein
MTIKHSDKGKILFQTKSFSGSDFDFMPQKWSETEFIGKIKQIKT